MLWYSLEVPCWGASNEYPQHMFLLRNKKNTDIFWLEKTPYQELCSSALIGIHCTCKISADNILKQFSYSSNKTGPDTLCKLSPNKTGPDTLCKLSPKVETICKKCQILFSGKIRKKHHSSVKFAQCVIKVDGTRTDENIKIKPVDQIYSLLTLGAPITTAADDNFFLFIYLFFFRENKSWHYMWIICLADDSHEMSTVFSEKYKKNNFWVWRLICYKFCLAF